MLSICSSNCTISIIYIAIFHSCNYILLVTYLYFFAIYMLGGGAVGLQVGQGTSPFRLHLVQRRALNSMVKLFLQLFLLPLHLGHGTMPYPPHVSQSDVLLVF